MKSVHPFYVAYIVTCSSLALAATIHVNGTTGNDAWNGLCAEWDGAACGPKASIQAGIDAALAGDEVTIADGVYIGLGNKNLDFGGRPITLRSASGDPNLCIIDCERDGRAFHFHAGEGPASILQDLSIQNTTCDVGGIYCQSASPTLLNCTVTDGTATFGAGLYCESNAHPTLINCTFANNFASRGAGVGCAQHSCPTLTNCVMRDNIAAYGAGLWCFEDSAPTVTDCTISGNIYSDFGAGVECDGSNPTFIRCTFTENRADYGGGALHCRYATPTLINCVLSNNSGGDSGGGLCSRCGANPLLVACTITRNTANNRGGGVRCDDAMATLVNCAIIGNSARYGGGLDCLSQATPILTNCVIAANTASRRGGGLRIGLSHPTLTNCILWFDFPEEISVESGSPTATYCNIQGGWPGLGNINADPLFIQNPNPGPDRHRGTPDDDAGDLHLQPASPCIDAGTNLHPPRDLLDLDDDGCRTEPVPLDLVGNARYWDAPDTPDTGAGASPIIDMGLYEYASTPDVPPGPCAADCNCDGTVNYSDIDPFVAALAGQSSYLARYPDCFWLSADCDNDGLVSYNDINAFVEQLTY